MKLNNNSSIAELRTELDNKRAKANELQFTTTDPEEWSALNTLRWELEDLDKNIYLSQFIKNSEQITKLVGEINQATQDAQRLIASIDEIEKAITTTRAKIKNTSVLADELSSFLGEVESTMDLLKGSQA